jgi:methyl-accepting chemotaxis protein
MSEQLDNKQIQILEETFAKLAPQGDALVEKFYSELFSRYPEVKPLFANVDQKEQEKKLLSGLVLVINNIRKPEVLGPALSNMGKNHQKYGAVAEHYPAVAETLLDVMSEFAGDLWTDEVKQSWTNALNTVAAAMLDAYENSDDETMIKEDEKMDNLDSSENDTLKQELNEALGKISAIDKVQAVIEFDLDGTIITANDNFLNTLGYTLEEIQGKHHSMFADPTYAVSPEYKEFWEKLNRGEFDAGEYKRIGKGGKEVWINASYNPVLDADGKPYKVIKFATDVTVQKLEHADFSGKLDAVSQTQAVIEFNLDGTIITANKNFTDAVGYTLEEIQGKHHSMFVDATYAGGQEYKDFWQKLNNGESQTGQFKRLNKKGEELWLNASYNTVFDMNDKPFKVVKYATDGTELRTQQISAARLQTAIDGAQANLMLCDEDLNITYANPAVIGMLRNRQNELRAIWPGLNVDKLVGENIDQFHKNPAHQRNLLGNINALPANAEIKVGGLEFGVNATAITDEEGNYMGNMVEWRDITEEKDAERQIENLIDAATNGELDTRLEADNYTGFMQSLAGSINNLMNAVVVPINESTRVIESLSDGDLTQSMDGEFNGQFLTMQSAVNSSISNLMKMVGEIRESAGSINTSANEIAQGNLDLSQRTEEQASSLEETASSIEELTGTVKQNADNAQQANQLAEGAKTEAEKGGAVVSQAIEAMGEINQASKKIADIIGVIDEIAFQTNLLALNAAVEAARAGEQGRGFAVVAAEVRNLAQRSAGAAKEIKTLINDSVQKVDEGSRLVDESGSTLEEIVASVQKVNDIIAEIAAASSEQSTGIDQINKAVAQMDEMTQQNASLVEEAAAASESMDEQAKGLTGLIGFFNTGDGSTGGNQLTTSERRRNERPWKEEAQAKSSANVEQKVASAGGDSEWEEF